MHGIYLFICINALVLGFGLAIAGFVALINPDERELEELKAKTERLHEFNWLKRELMLRKCLNELFPPSRVFVSWMKRPQARKLIYLSIGLFAAAATVGYFGGLLK